MATTNTNAKLLDRKLWEMVTPAPVATAAAMLVTEAGDLDPNQLKLYITSATVHYLYFPLEDAWLQIPSGALAGTFGAGACAEWSPLGATGTATAGSATTMTTNLTIPGSLVGYKFRTTGGTGAGQTITITGNTTGANSVISFASTGTALDGTTTYELLTGRFYVLNAYGTLAAGVFKYYDVATNTWSGNLTTTGLPASWATDGRLTGTCHNSTAFATGTATAGASTTITNSGKSWTSNQWANAFQVRITAGTGAGQKRIISSNTGTVITVSSSWTVTPDATSVYAIENNEDYLYLMGNNAVTLYRYSISGNSWSTLSPGAARAAAPGAGATFNWVWAQTDSAWTSESAIINGKRIYSFRGGAGAVLDYYDVAANTWVSGVTYQRSTETFTTGSSSVYVGGYIYIQKEATGRWFRYDPTYNQLDAWSTTIYTQGAAVLGNKCFSATYTDGATVIRWVYFLLNTSTVAFRCMII